MRSAQIRVSAQCIPITAYMDLEGRSGQGPGCRTRRPAPMPVIGSRTLTRMRLGRPSRYGATWWRRLARWTQPSTRMSCCRFGRALLAMSTTSTSPWSATDDGRGISRGIPNAFRSIENLRSWLLRGIVGGPSADGDPARGSRQSRGARPDSDKGLGSPARNRCRIDGRGRGQRVPGKPLAARSPPLPWYG
jgi:hypothetical protein